MFKNEVLRHYLKQGLQKRCPFFSLQAHHWVYAGRSFLVLKQIEQVGTLLFQKSSSIPESVELISPEDFESCESSERAELRSFNDTSESNTRVNKFYSSFLFIFGIISSNYF
ncbi:MAG: hypothetical protein ACK5NI_00110 [bacterium]